MKRLTIFVLLISSIIWCLTMEKVQAQEKLFPLKHNPAYDLAANKAEKGFRKSFDNVCLNPLSISITNILKPNNYDENTATGDLGSISINISGGESDYTYYLNDDLIDTTTETNFTFENLEAGAYFIKVIDGVGDIVEIFFPLSHEGLPNLDEGTIGKDNKDIGCLGEQGYITFLSVVGVECLGASAILDIYDAATNELLGTLTNGGDTIRLNAGLYYADLHKDPNTTEVDPATFCHAYDIFEVKYQNVLRLPFIEDFSTSSVYPNDSVWSNNYAFINNTYAKNAISMGVATLDGFNQFGQPYTPSNSSAGDDFVYGQADALTSNPFCFDGAIADSLYMTFFYQEQGYGDFPNVEDSLIIEFEITRDTVYTFLDDYNFEAICFTLENETEIFEDCIAYQDMISIDSEHIFYVDTTFTSVTDSLTEDFIYIDLTEYDFSLLDSTLIFTREREEAGLYTLWETLTGNFVVRNLLGDTLNILNETKIGGVEAIIENPEFKRVDLAIPPEYMQDNFRFRFRNLATISGNNDHWNIDYIWLNDEPLSNNLSEVAHTQDVSSMLKRYQQMPWRHFINHLDESLADEFYATIRTINATSDNIINITDFVTVNDVCLDAVSPILERDNTSNYPDDAVVNIAQSKISLQNNLDEIINDDNISETFVQRDSVILEVEWIVEGGANELLNTNDKIYRYQTFFNYFALDDGSAERAYGLNGVGSRLAMQYILNEEDSLRAIQINFVNMNANIENLEFNLNVWKKVKAETNEDSLLYSSAAYETAHFLNQVNGFWTYTLEMPIAVSDTIYVGLEQRNTQPIYIGFDTNINSAEQTFYNTSGQWLNSIFEGTPMIRPVVGSQLPPDDQLNVGVNDGFETEKQAIVLYPNPTSDILYLKSANDIHEIEIYDYAGKMMQTNRINDTAINVQDFAKGLYLVRFFDKEKNVMSTAKFVKQ